MRLTTLERRPLEGRMPTAKWQHILIEENYEPNTPVAALETAGKDGWEAVGMAVYGGRLIVLCKRPGD